MTQSNAQQLWVAISNTSGMSCVAIKQVLKHASSSVMAMRIPTAADEQQSLFHVTKSDIPEAHHGTSGLCIFLGPKFFDATSLSATEAKVRMAHEGARVMAEVEHMRSALSQRLDIQSLHIEAINLGAYPQAKDMLQTHSIALIFSCDEADRNKLATEGNQFLKQMIKEAKALKAVG